jgi:predicted unusual protein kinase regulating ubiquinone biosynthesis (AarF/ABC1/UbiB family)
MTDSKDKPNNSGDLKEIATGALGRGFSVFSLSVVTGVKLVGHKIVDVFQEKQLSQERLERFWQQQVHHLVDEMGRLKGTIMKAGQMLSVYGEHFFPEDINRVLKRLQSQSQTLAWDVMDKVLRQQLGKDIHQKLEFDTTPVAAASMGQVYRAYDRQNGQVYAVKIQYPRVDQAIDSDLKVLRRILSLSKLIPKGENFDGIFREVSMMLHYEVDYERELAMLNQYRQLLAGDDRFIVPQAFSEYSSRRILTLSYEDGHGIDSSEVAALPQLSRNRLAASFLELLLLETFSWRFVQTDPHFGNYKVRLGQQGEPDRFVLLDFGAVRKFPKRYTEPLSRLAKAVIAQNESGVVQGGLDLGFLRAGDGPREQNLFYRLCATVLEPFSEAYESQDREGTVPGVQTFHWGETDLLKRASLIGKDAAFAFKLRPPPREAVFLDRKIGGAFIVLAKLKYNCGPRKLLLSHLDLNHE